MRVGFALLIALLAAALQPAAARAQAKPMQALIGSEFYHELVSHALAAIPATVFPRCPALVSKGSQVTVLNPVAFGADGRPKAGLWRHTFPVSGCGNDTTINLFFSAGTDEKITTLFGVPGSTHADLALQRDALQYANIGAELVARDCRSFMARNTRFEGYTAADAANPGPASAGPGRAWRETWTMAGCGRTIDVPLDFVPDATGTQITQSGGKER